jgi:outer membrane protein assembly factor BamA
MIQGNDPVSDKYLYPYLGLYPGMVYNESRLKQIPDRIENIAFLTQIREFELEFSEGDRVNVFLYLERAESNQVDGVVGFLPGGEGKIRFTGQFDLSLSNIFRRGEYLAVNWNSLEKQSQQFNLQMDFPYLLLQSVGINASLDLYKKDTSFLSRTFRAGLSFYISSQSRLEVFGDFEGSSLISEAPEVKERYEPFQMRLYGTRYVFNNLDYRLNPSRGLELDLFGSLGRRRGGEDDESRTSAETGLDIAWYQPLFGSWVVKASGHGRFKYIWTERNKGFRENELYRFGGFESLRGFDDHAFLAPVYSVVSLELRYLLSRNSNLYAFWDGGWYQRDIAPRIKEDFPFGFGVGVHIDTGGGIMYISYALGKQAENPIEPGSGKIHLGYVNKF